MCGVWLAGLTIFPCADNKGEGSNGLCLVPIVVSTFEAGRFITVCRSLSQHGTAGSSILNGMFLTVEKALCFSSALRRPG